MHVSLCVQEAYEPCPISSFYLNRSWIAIKPPLSFAYTRKLFNAWRDTVADLEGSTAALAGSLDSGASQGYALSTTRARN